MRLGCGAQATRSGYANGWVADGVSVDLAGQTILVTGASSGVGRAFACAAAQAGARLVLCARTASGLDRCVEEIVTTGEQAVAIATDVSREVDIVAAFDLAIARFGRIDSVVAAAGINIPGRATDIDVQDIDHMLDVNVRGMLLTAREAARRMMAQVQARTGAYRILLVGSAAGLAEGMGAMPRLATYSASKAAVDMLGRSLASEWATVGINVNVIHPGVTATEMNAQWLESPKGRALMNRFPRSRGLAVEQLLPLMLFLMSPGADAITGGRFLIDDGQTL